MPLSNMRNAVFQATGFYILAMLVDHHMSQNMFDQVTNNEGWLNMLAALNTSAPYFQPPPNTSGQLTLDAGNNTRTNTSLAFSLDKLHATMNVTHGALGKEGESFYFHTLPINIIIYVVLGTLQYWWLIWLERMFPARPRNIATAYVREEKIEDSEDREEEVVKKWIAQGRIHRASLNWCNTFLKWVLEMTVGVIMMAAANHILTGFSKFQSPKTLLVGLKKEVIYNLVGVYFSPTPFIMLVAFVVMPAHRQLVFLAGADLVMTIFITTLWRAFLAWGINTNLVQSTMKKVANHAKKMESDSEYRARFYKTNNDWGKNDL